MNRGERIAQIEKELKSARSELDGINEAISGLQERRAVVDRQARALANQLDQLKPKELQITDHVVLRYMEREQGIDVEGVRAMLKERLQGAENMGALKVQGFVIKGNAVITYVPPKT